MSYMAGKFLSLHFTDLAEIFGSTTISWDKDELDSVATLFDESSVIGFADIENSDSVLKPVL